MAEAHALMAHCDIAIVIPVRNDAAALDALLHRVRNWPLEPAEIIVVAKADEPALESVCKRWNCRRLIAEPCRGAQLDDGARAATARICWFLHADAVPSAACVSAITDAYARGMRAGYFRFEFTGPRTWQRRVLEFLIRWRVQWGGIPYGDQGLWIDRTVYRDCGGFAREPLFEEVALVKRLRRRGRLAALREPIGVAARRWEREGWWRRSFRNRVLALGYALGMPAASLAACYYPLQWAPRDRDA